MADGVVHIESDDSRVYALDATTGAKRWSCRTGDKDFSNPAAVDDIAYMGSDDFKMYALDAATGHPKPPLKKQHARTPVRRPRPRSRPTRHRLGRYRRLHLFYLGYPGQEFVVEDHLSGERYVCEGGESQDLWSNASFLHAP